MNVEATHHEGAARVVALLVTAKGTISDSGLRALERMHAFPSLGIDRQRFIELARTYACEVGSHLGETSWLRNGDRKCLDQLLREVTDPAERALVCRLAAAVVAAEGGVCSPARLLYGHMLASWRICAPAAGDMPAS
jgi:hypothetical protein